MVGKRQVKLTVNLGRVRWAGVSQDLLDTFRLTVLFRMMWASYSGRMTATTISVRVDEHTMAELRQLAGDRSLSDAIRELIHAQYAARLYAQAARDAERLRNDPADLAEIKAVNEALDEISAW